MELVNFEGLTLGSIIAGVLSPIFIFVGNQIAKWSRGVRLISRLVFLITNKFAWRLLLQVTCALLVGFAVQLLTPKLLGQPINGPFVGSLIFALLLLYQQWKFAMVGAHSAQLSIKSGTDYRAALDLCRNNFSFLGTGAYKLTSERNFDETVQRCDSDNQQPVRFLLSSPENPLIAEAEKKAGVVPGTYKQNVLQSLRNLKRLREEKNRRFEVRFYRADAERDFENFRMMLIDDDIMLLSYNVYGKDAAGSTAQLVLFKSSMTSSSENFYFAFQGYFERLWQSSDTWDGQEHV